MKHIIDEFKLKFKKENLKSTIFNAILVLLGTFVLAIGTELFIIPANLDTGGLSGIGICFTYAGSSIDPELVISIAVWVLFFLGLLFLGIDFSIKTLASTIFYPVFLYLLKALVTKVPWLLLESSPLLESEEALNVMLSSVFGGAFVGAGCAITFLGGGSTGGVDIITFIICKYIKKIKTSHMIFAIDATIIILGFIINPSHDLSLCLLGVLSAMISAVVVDKVFEGSMQAFVAYIVTEKYDEITKDIIEKVDRTTSIVDVKGGYSQEMKKMIMVSFSIREYAQVVSIVRRLDRKAFMTITKAHEINGEGFKPL